MDVFFILFKNLICYLSSNRTFIKIVRVNVRNFHSCVSFWAAIVSSISSNLRVVLQLRIVIDL